MRLCLVYLRKYVRVTANHADVMQLNYVLILLPEGRVVEIFRTCPHRHWGPPSTLYNGYWILPRITCGRGVTLTPHRQIMPWSRKSRVISALPLRAVRPVQNLSACTRVHFTFTFNFIIRLCLFNDATVAWIAQCLSAWWLINNDLEKTVKS